MYLGSVKFYKHLIYFVIAVILILALVGLLSLLGLIMPDLDAEAANTDNINNISYKQEDKNQSIINENSSDKKAPSESKNTSEGLTDKIDNKVSKEPTAFEKFPDLHCKKSEIKANEKKTAYITFDDGPSGSTIKILDLLKKRNIKATFFVVTGGSNAPNLDILKQINDEGHAIGIHSNSHIYKEIYDSVDSYLADLNTAFNIICRTTNEKPTVVRFPGGSVNDANAKIYDEITTELTNRNFRYYDWNVSFEDAKKNITSEEIYQSALNGIEKYNGNDLIILAHDRTNNEKTLEALIKIIDVLESYDYSFDKLDNSVEPITFSYK